MWNVITLWITPGLLNELHLPLYMVLFTYDQYNVDDVPFEAIQV